MSVVIAKKVDVSIELSPKDLAEVFAKMSEEEQHMFFIHLRAVTNRFSRRLLRVGILNYSKHLLDDEQPEVD